MPKYHVYVSYLEETPAVIGLEADSLEDAKQKTLDHFSDTLKELQVIEVEELKDTEEFNAEEMTEEEIAEELGVDSEPTIH